MVYTDSSGKLRRGIDPNKKSYTKYEPNPNKKSSNSGSSSGSDGANSNTLPETSPSDLDRFKEATKDLVNSKGAVKPGKIEEYRKAYDQYIKNPRDEEAFRRAGISKPVVKQSNESNEEAVRRSARETAKLVARNQTSRTGKPAQVSVSVTSPVLNKKTEIPQQLNKPNNFKSTPQTNFKDQFVNTEDGTYIPESARQTNFKAFPDPKPLGVIDASKDAPISAFQTDLTGKYTLKEMSTTEQVKQTFTGVGRLATSFLSTVFVEPVKAIFSPKQTYESIVSTVKNPSAVGLQLGETISTDPAKGVGTVLGIAFTPRVIKGTVSAGKNLYVKTGSAYVAPETVFSDAVLSGAETMPKTKSIPESISRFKQADDLTVTASPKKISGTTAGVGKKAESLLEDPGIYVTPAGEGSPYFLRLSESNFNYVSGSEATSLNPAKGLFGVPTATRFKTSGVTQYPRNIISQKGFETVAKFQEEQLAGTGKVVITKRSEIGQGNILEKGSLGTSEIEAVVPVGQKFTYTPQTTAGKIKGFDTYTTIDGRNIAIRDADLVISKDFDGIKAVNPNAKPLSGSQLVSEASYTESSNLGSYGTVLSSSGVIKIKQSNPAYFSESNSNVISISPGSSGSSKSKVITSSAISYPEKSVSSSFVSSSSPVRSSGGSSRSSNSSAVSSSSVVSSSSPISSNSSAVSSGSSPISSLSSGASSSSGSVGSSVNYPKQPPNYKIFRNKENSNENRGGFNVFSRKGQKLNVRALLKEEAVNFGRDITGKTALTSFRVEATSERATPGQFRGKAPATNFYQDRKGFFVEKTKFRIDTPGELGEITFSPKNTANKKGSKKKKSSEDDNKIFGRKIKWV